MLIVFQIRDDLISHQGAACLAQTPPFWNMCEKYGVYQEGTIDEVEAMLKKRKDNENRTIE